ncbi:MAG: hypothetical protein ACOQNV_00590 [Mycoplasmoidaceae bacterium]
MKKIIPIVVPSILLAPLASCISCGSSTHDYSKDCLTFTAINDLSFDVDISGIDYVNKIEFSKDNGKTWSTFMEGDQNPDPVNIAAGQSVILKGDNSTSDIKFPHFTFTNSVNISGNIMSLIDNGLCQATTIPSDNCFVALFGTNNTSDTFITNAKNLVLPATQLTNQCYCNMFSHCEGLVSCPEILPATDLTDRESCYKNMFQGCKLITNAPYIKANKLSVDCFENMFSGCTKLNKIKIDFTGQFSTAYFKSWVENVQTQTGSFYYNGYDVYNFGSNSIPNNWKIVRFG